MGKSKKEWIDSLKLEGFDKFYNELLNSNHGEFDNAWQESYDREKKKKKVRWILYLIIDTILIIMLFNLFSSNSIRLNSRDSIVVGVLAIGFVNVAIFAGVNLKYSDGRTDFQKLYKESVVKKVINKFYSDLIYLPESKTPEEIYQVLNYEKYDGYISHDYFKGKIDDKYNIEMSEVSTYIRTTNADGRNTTEHIFDGLFAKIDLPKTLPQQIKIIPNSEKTLRDSVNMDSVSFEKVFDVISTDKILAMQLLTSDCMVKLTDIENKLPDYFDIYIKNNELYIRLHCDSVFDYVSLKNKGMDEEIIRKYYYVMDSMYNIAKIILDMVESTPL